MEDEGDLPTESFPNRYTILELVRRLGDSDVVIFVAVKAPESHQNQ
jgi:hypothetical protein